MSIREKHRTKSRGILPHKEMFSYGEYPKSWPKELKLAQAIRHYNIMQDSVELIENTLSEDTFRNRYEAAVREAQIVVKLCGKKGIGIRAGRVLRYLVNEKEQIVDDFIARAMN